MLIFNESEICGIRSTKRFDWKMSVELQITFSGLKFFLYGIEDKHSRFISDEQFHLIVPVYFPSRI